MLIFLIHLGKKTKQFKKIVGIKMLILNILQKIKLIMGKTGKETLHGLTRHLAKQFQLTLENDS